MIAGLLFLTEIDIVSCDLSASAVIGSQASLRC